MTECRLDPRPLGHTGLSLTPLGFGAAAIGNLYRAVDDVTAHHAIDTALACGLRYFDTAPHYGFGLSEKRLGRALSERSDITLSTKVGRVLDPAPDADLDAPRQGFVSPEPLESAFDYSYDGFQRSFEESLCRLGRDRIDIVLVHDLGRDTHGESHEARFAEFLDGGLKALQQWREDGRVSAIGLGVNEIEICERVLDHADLDGLLLAGRYTLLEQQALDGLLPRCAARGVSLIIGGPFNSGILVRGTAGTQPLHYNYSEAPPTIVEQVRRIESVCAAHGVPLPAAALQFPLAHTQVCSVIPGAADAAQVRSARDWLETPIPATFWSALREAGLLHPDAPVPAP